MEDFDFDREIPEFLADCRTASLATVDPDGGPHAANVQYVHDGALKLYFVSSPESAHSRHIGDGGPVAVTIYARNDQPDQIRGVQVHGVCRPVHDETAMNRVWELYVEKFAFAQTYPMRRTIESQQFYELTPHWMRWIDNRRGFGWKVERELD